MNAKELPARPNLEQYRKQAKDLLKSHKSGAIDGLKRIRRNHPRLTKLSESEVQSARFVLTDAQLVIAREHGFESWPKFSKHIEAMAQRNSPAAKFEAAADAIVSGNAAELERLLRESPELVRERSPRTHQATLLHYVGSNGVENYRQKAPANIAQIAEILLRAGSDVNAIGNMYGGSTTLGLAATSIHPALAGVQRALMDVLLRYGASIDGPGLVVNGCLANGRGDAARYLAERGAILDLEGAAGVGRLAVVKTFFDRGALKPDVPRKKLDLGLMWACQYGRTEVVEFLLGNTPDVDIMPHGETGLHWAAYNAHVDIVKLLLAKGARVDLIATSHGGTPLGWALYGWFEPSFEAERGSYYGVVARLVAAGAVPDRGWLASTNHRKRLVEKIDGDPRMVAALKGEPTG